MKDVEPDMDLNIGISYKELGKAPQVTQMRAARREQRWGRATLPLTCPLPPQCPCRWGFVPLTPYPKSRLGLRLKCPAPWMAWKRKVWRKQGWGTARLTLAGLGWHQCPWSSRLCGSLNLKPNKKAPLDWDAGHHGWHRRQQHGVSKVGACPLPPQCPWSCRICFSGPYQSLQTGAEAPSQMGLPCFVYKWV